LKSSYETADTTAKIGFIEMLRSKKNSYSMDMGMARAEHDKSLPPITRKEHVRMYVVCAEKA
jgi:hypothetical protein